MSEIALCNTLRRINGISDDEAKEVATKANLKAEIARLETKLIEKIAQQEARMTWKMIALSVAIVGIIKYS